MKLLKKRALSKSQSEEVSILVKLCREAEETSVDFPLDDSDFIYLLYDNQKLVSTLSLFFPDSESCECRAFTHPDFRRKGYFSMLLDEVVDELDAREEAAGSDISFYFVTDGKSHTALMTLKALDARYWYSEYMMKLPLPSGKTVSSERCTEKIHLVFYQEDNSVSFEICDMYQLPASQDPVFCRIFDDLQNQIGSFMLAKANQEEIYLYGFEIREEQRGKGFGKMAVEEVIHILSQISLKSLSLQVSEQNRAAFSLYKKTGFQITETLSYYLY